MFSGNVGSVVCDVVLMGIPLSTSLSTWKEMRSVVGGRLVNCFSRNDWLLALLCRGLGTGLEIAGVSPVPHCAVENIDVSDMVSSHGAYREVAKHILKRVLS